MRGGFDLVRWAVLSAKMLLVELFERNTRDGGQEKSRLRSLCSRYERCGSPRCARPPWRWAGPPDRDCPAPRTACQIRGRSDCRRGLRRVHGARAGDVRRAREAACAASLAIPQPLYEVVRRNLLQGGHPGSRAGAPPDADDEHVVSSRVGDTAVHRRGDARVVRRRALQPSAQVCAVDAAVPRRADRMFSRFIGKSELNRVNACGRAAGPRVATSSPRMLRVGARGGGGERRRRRSDARRGARRRRLRRRLRALAATTRPAAVRGEPGCWRSVRLARSIPLWCRQPTFSSISTAS